MKVVDAMTKIMNLFFIVVLLWNSQIAYGSESNWQQKAIEQGKTLDNLLHQLYDLRVGVENLKNQFRNKNEAQPNMNNCGEHKPDKNDNVQIDGKNEFGLTAAGTRSTVISSINGERGYIQFCANSVNCFIDATASRDVKDIEVQFLEGACNNHAIIYLSPFGKTAISAKTVVGYKSVNLFNKVTVYSWHEPKVEVIEGVSINVYSPLRKLILPSMFLGVVFFCCWMICNNK